MRYFAGLDVGLEETTICIIDSNGGIVRELRACSEPEALVRALRPGCPLRAGRPRGVSAVLLAVRRLGGGRVAGCVPGGPSPPCCPRGHDPQDGSQRCPRHRAGAPDRLVQSGARQDGVEPGATHFADGAQEDARAGFDVETTIRGLLKGHGLKVGRVTRTTFAPRVRELVAAVPVLAAAIEPLLTAHATLRKSFTELHRQVLAVTRIDPVSRRLMTVPGIGAVTALAYCSAVDIPERFPRSRAVGAHFGLVPRKYQSGTTDRNGRITKAGDALVRTALYEAANVLLTRVTRWSPLKAWAVRLAQRIGGKRAKVALARNLAVILHRIWIDGTTFTWTRERAMAAV